MDLVIQDAMDLLMLDSFIDIHDYMDLVIQDAMNLIILDYIHSCLYGLRNTRCYGPNNTGFYSFMII